MIAHVSDAGEQAGEPRTDVEQMLLRLREGDPRVLSRAISIVEDGHATAAGVLAACRRWRGTARTVGVTGPPGAGKSTLVDQMIRSLRGEGKRVAVLAVDPSSPLTGGALLGDRIRMQGFAADPGVFIRSLASRGALGGLTRTLRDVCCVTAAAGFDVILVETVGVGQEGVDVAGLVDVAVLVLVPGMGDEVQSLKAGVMEIADVFAINKADRGGAEQVEAQVLETQGLALQPGGQTARVVKTSALSGAGVAELMSAIWSCHEYKLRADARSSRVEPGRQGTRLDHLGVAVKSLGKALRFYHLLGLEVAHEETVEHEGVRTAMLPVGEGRIELLEPSRESSPIARFLARRGEGLHHVALHVESVDGMFEAMQREGVRLVSDEVRVGAGGHRYFFVHPESAGGVLVEIVGDAAGEI